jgi:hypothetical protein
MLFPVSEEGTMTDAARFTARCPDCGEVELLAEQMWLVLTNVPGREHYGVDCPGCGRTFRHAADAATVGLLSTLVPVETLDLPAEALEVHTGPAITIDDVLDAMLILERRVPATVAFDLGCGRRDRSPTKDADGEGHPAEAP